MTAPGAGEREFVRATLCLGGERAGWRLRDERVTPRGWWGVFRRSGEDTPEDVFCFTPSSGAFVTISISTVVDAALHRERLAGILEIAAEHDVAVAASRDRQTPPGETYLNLSLRVFLEGLTPGILEIAAANLLACREALAAAFEVAAEEEGP